MPETRKTSAKAPHTTSVSMNPDPVVNGGTWEAQCTCGWSETGEYARDRYADSARAVAEEAAAGHKGAAG